MSHLFGAFDSWLIDVYLLATVLIVLGGCSLIWLRQPARRMAAARSMLVGLAMLIVLAAAPRWPRIGIFGRLSGESAPIQSGSVAPLLSIRSPSRHLSLK